MTASDAVAEVVVLTIGGPCCSTCNEADEIFHLEEVVEVGDNDDDDDDEDDAVVRSSLTFSFSSSSP